MIITKKTTRKKQKWLICLIISLASELSSFVVMFLAEKLQIDMFYTAPRFIDKLFSAICYGLMTVSMLSFAAMIVYLVKLATKKRRLVSVFSLCSYR